MNAPLILPANVVRNKRGTCATCIASLDEKDGDLICRMNPPQATVIMVPAPPPRVGTLMPMPFTVFPIVRPEQGCRQWAPKE